MVSYHLSVAVKVFPLLPSHLLPLHHWRSKVSRRWGYGSRSVRPVSPERKDVPQEEDSTSSDSSQLEPLSSSLTKLLNEPARKSLSYLLDASTLYDSDSDSDDDSDSSPTPAPPKESSSSPEIGNSPKSMFTSAFEHFHSRPYYEW